MVGKLSDRGKLEKSSFLWTAGEPREFGGLETSETEIAAQSKGRRRKRASGAFPLAISEPLITFSHSGI